MDQHRKLILRAASTNPNIPRTAQVLAESYDDKGRPMLTYYLAKDELLRIGYWRTDIPEPLDWKDNLELLLCLMSYVR